MKAVYRVSAVKLRYSDILYTLTSNRKKGNARRFRSAVQTQPIQELLIKATTAFGDVNLPLGVALGQSGFSHPACCASW